MGRAVGGRNLGGGEELGEMAERSARWAVEAKAPPSSGRSSAWGGPLNGERAEELQAEEETEGRGIKHRRALWSRARGST